jgi:hypothetical protein
MRKRLEELNWRRQPTVLKKEVHGDAVEVSNSALPGEVLASPKAQHAKKAG